MQPIFRTLLLAVMLLCLSTNCSAPEITPQTDIPPSLVQQRKAVAQEIQDAHLRVELELSNTLLRDNQVLEIWYARPDSIRVEVLESTHPGFRDIFAASQGDTGWTYRHATRQVDAGPIDNVKPAIIYDVVRSTLSLLWKTDPDRIDTMSTDYVGGKWTYKLTGSGDTEPCTVWLQQDTLLPLKVQCESMRLGQYTAVINEAEYNIGLTDDLFDLTLLPSETYTVRRIR
jgi:outer membrane lipoprotein-sorting protein